MTQWVDSDEGGRPRGPIGVARAWYEVLVRPRRFFQSSIAPGDQAPGLLFAAAIVLVEEGTRLSLVDGAIPVFRDQPALSALVWLLAAVLLIAPAAVHLTAAAETLVLVGLAPDRGGVSETVQVICYAMAPCVLAGLPSPPLSALVATWSVGLLILGTHVVHEVSLPRASLAALVPATLIFGVGFRGIESATSALRTMADVFGVAL